MKHKNYTLTILTSFALLSSANAAITAVGGTSDFTFESSDWQSHTANDIDGNGLGTDGTFFMGQGFDTSTNVNNQPFTYVTSDLPSYASVAAGADFLSIAQSPGQSLIDNPDDLTGDDVNSGTAVARNGASPAGDFIDDVLRVTISSVDPGQTIRLGFLVSNEGTADGRWDGTSYTISDGVNSVTFGDHAGTQLAIVPGNDDAAWILVDVDAAGTYTIGGTKRLASNQGISVGGVTFDSIPEPSSTALLGLGGLALILRRRK